MAVTIRTLDASHAALGIAPHVLARRAPFSGFRFGDLSQTVDDQIRRGHALFASASGTSSAISDGISTIGPMPDASPRPGARRPSTCPTAPTWPG